VIKLNRRIATDNQLKLSQQSTWQHFTHEADIGIRGIGVTLAESFEQAAYALMAVIIEPGSVQASHEIEIVCEAPDREILLVDWLNALIYEMAVQHLLFAQFHVQTDGKQLKAVVRGETLDRDRHQPAVEIKGATLTELKVQQDSEGRWIAQCVVDV